MEPSDKSNGYEEVAKLFMSDRDSLTGVSTVRQWSRTLVRGSSILDLGCGHGVPISQALIEDGFTLYGVDASASLTRVAFAMGRRFCAPDRNHWVTLVG
jgi:2-polyprenyl-3-methyl-5-hydroxy-6-metoxy-1,4-benzoquinol methylase